MADDVLSAAELETLARALAPPPLRPSAARERSAAKRDAIVPYARRESPKPNDALVRSIAAVHDRCCRPFAAELSTLLRRPACVRVLPLCQASYREFAAQLANPTCFNLLSAAPLEGPWILEISPSILFPAIDCMLGGGGRAAQIAARPMTDIELRLAARITNLLVHHLRAAWQDAVRLDLSVERVACSPHSSGMIQAADAVVWTRFELEWVGHRGLLNLAIPLASLEAVAAELSGGCAPKSPSPRHDDPSPEPPGGSTTSVELVACLAQSTISADDARNLAIGDLITTEQPTDAPIAVLRDGVVLFRARAGVVDARKALEIEEVVSTDAAAPPS